MTQPTLERLESIEHWDEFLAAAGERPVWILKHSLICPLSGEGLREFEAFATAKGDESLFAVIEIQRARDLSAEVAARLLVRHQSPQAILIVQGEALWHGSHWDVSVTALEAAGRDHLSPVSPSRA